MRLGSLLLIGVVAGCATANSDAPVDVSQIHGDDGGLLDAIVTDSRVDARVVDAVPIDAVVISAIPSVTTISPTAVLVGSPDTLVTLTGAGFEARTTVSVDGQPAVTNYVSATELRATIPARSMTAAGMLSVTATTSPPGGGTSSPKVFTVENPAPTLTSVSPASSTVGATSAVTLTLVGDNFVATSVVKLDGTSLAAQYVSATMLTATVPTTMLTTARTAEVTVENPAPGGGASLPRPFSVGNVTPVISSLSPSQAIVGSAATTLTVNGTGFVSGSSVQFGATSLTTTFVSSTRVTAALTTTQLSSAQTATVKVANPAPGGGTSNGLTFTVGYPTPVATSLTPSGIEAGSASTSIAVTGSGFVSGSSVAVNGTPISTTYVSATRLTAAISASLLSTPRTLSITVSNPAPLGGTSSALSLPISCNTSGVDLVLSAKSSVETHTLDYSLGPAIRYVSASTTASSYTCPLAQLSTATTTTRNYAGFVVQNTTAQTATLEAWANCTAADDAFLVFYSGSTVPKTDTERRACATYVAEGLNGSGARESINSNGSPWCPGLTKANGGGLTLLACEKAVIVVQPYFTTDWPVSLSVQLN